MEKLRQIAPELLKAKLSARSSGHADLLSIILSARKIVLETAKYNVITAHSSQELLEDMQVFLGCSAIIIHEHLLQNLAAMIRQVKQRRPDTAVMLLSPNQGESMCADYHINSHDAQQLLNLVRDLFGDPSEIKAQNHSGADEAGAARSGDEDREHKS